MKIEVKLNACRNQFVYERFLEDYYSDLRKLYEDINFIHAISEVSQNTSERLLYGIDADESQVKGEVFKNFKDTFCDIFFKSLKFSDYPDYKSIYYDIKEKGYSGKSATISVFYSMVYFDVLKEASLQKEKVSSKVEEKKGLINRLFGDSKENSPQRICEKKSAYSNFSLKNGYKEFLVESGYKEYTPSGLPSTVYQYIDAIEKVCEQEYMDWVGIAKNIEMLVKRYNWGGEKESFGNKGHRTVINAILRYSEFLKRNY